MVWPFGKKKPEEPQGPDFVGAGALRSVMREVMLGQRGYAALPHLSQLRVTEEGTE